MDVFYRQYNTYRILLSALGLWPYHKSIYSTIHRISISVIMLAYIVFQVLWLFKSGITFRGCIVTLSATCPVMAFFMRYVSSVAIFPVTIYLFDNLRTMDTTLKDQVEVQILMKYIDYSTSVISIFLYLCCSWALFASSYVFAPITLDLLSPLDEPRKRYFSLLTTFSHDRIEYVDIVYVNILVVCTIGLLCIAGTELMLTVFSHWMCGMFEITRFIDCALSNYMLHYLPLCSVIVVSFSVSLHRLSDAITSANDESEIFISSIFVISHMVILYISHYSGQIMIDRSLDVFKESYNSTWYCMPVEAQKLLLFIICRSSSESVIDIFGFFAASHVGFLKMLSTSFSYFTVICSSQ